MWYYNIVSKKIDRKTNSKKILQTDEIFWISNEKHMVFWIFWNNLLLLFSIFAAFFSLLFCSYLFSYSSIWAVLTTLVQSKMMPLICYYHKNALSFDVSYRKSVAISALNTIFLFCVSSLVQCQQDKVDVNTILTHTNTGMQAKCPLFLAHVNLIGVSLSSSNRKKKIILTTNWHWM